VAKKNSGVPSHKERKRRKTSILSTCGEGRRAIFGSVLDGGGRKSVHRDRGERGGTPFAKKEEGKLVPSPPIEKK